MIFPTGQTPKPDPKTVTLSDGQTFVVLVVRPTYHQRFNDEGRELRAYAGTDPDGFANYRLGRIRDCIVDWQDMTNEKGQPIPFTTQRLFSLMEAAPEVASQLVEIANEAFRPLGVAPKKSKRSRTSGGATSTEPQTDQQADQSVSIVTSEESADSPEQSESPPAS